MVCMQAEDGIQDVGVTGVQTCALPICRAAGPAHAADPQDVAGAARRRPRSAAGAAAAAGRTAEGGSALDRAGQPALHEVARSEDRRVGDAWRHRGWRYHLKNIVLTGKE